MKRDQLPSGDNWAFARSSLIALTCGLATTPASATDLPQYQVKRLGLYGAGYTATDGRQHSELSADLRIRGVIGGISHRFTPNLSDSGNRGFDMWIWNGAQTVQVGIYTNANTGLEGVRSGSFGLSNSRGQVAGTSNRYMGGLSPLFGTDAWIWTGAITQQVGLIDTQYTKSNGARGSRVLHLSDSGFAAGDSQRFALDGSSRGRDVWFWAGSTTRKIGLDGPAYSSPTGWRSHGITGLSEMGHVAGSSSIYGNNETSVGSHAWIWNGTETIRVGLFDSPQYTSTSGLSNQGFVFFRKSGIGAGESLRYQFSQNYLGQDAWIWNGSTTIQVGLLSSVNSGNQGFRFSRVTSLLDNGFASGYSERYYPNTPNSVSGRDAWVWNGSTTMRVGLTDGQYVSPDGNMESNVAIVTPTGQAAGTSTAFLPSSAATDTWMFDGTTTHRIGLTDPAHSRADGRRESELWAMNSQNQVAGYSVRYFGDNSAGQDAWIAMGGQTYRVGLTGSDYTVQSSGARRSQFTVLSDNGWAIGTSQRVLTNAGLGGSDAWITNGNTTTQIGLTSGPYLTSTGIRTTNLSVWTTTGLVGGSTVRVTPSGDDLGRDAWIWDGTTTRQVGLLSTGFVQPNGFRYSIVTAINELGVAAGISYTGNASNLLGDSAAWYYDPATQVSIPVIGSVNQFGSFRTSAGILTPTGYLLGIYTLYLPANESQEHAYVFRPDVGFSDLGTLVNGGLSSVGLSYLKTMHIAPTEELIVGYAQRIGQASGEGGNGVYALVRVPSPSTALYLFGAIAASRQRRRTFNPA